MADPVISLPVKIVKDVFAPKASRWRVALDHITGYGHTIAEAKAQVVQSAMKALDRLDTDPAFALDDDGSLIVAVQKSHGVEHFRVSGTTVRCITGTSGTPDSSLRSTPHYTVIGDD